MSFFPPPRSTTRRQEASNKMATATWNGTAMTQKDMMEKDTVLVLDDKDNVIGSESKRGSHEFTPATPHAVLHRAFSVFLFDKETGDFLLQKRASTKITFPNVRFLRCDGGFACTCFKKG
jgi:isopentenyl-diphosphate delta-isomerase